MYLLKEGYKEKILNGRTITSIAKEIGLTIGFINQIVNRRKKCSKLVAYCLCKIVNQDYEIEDFFERVK